MQRMLVLLVSALLSAGPATAEVAVASFQVGAHVALRVLLESQNPSSDVTIAAADVLRGETVVSGRYRVATNDPRGVVFEIAPRLGWAESVELEIDDGSAPLALGQVELLRRDCAPCELHVRYRVRLRAGTMPGTYPVPWQVRARPL